MTSSDTSEQSLEIVGLVARPGRVSRSRLMAMAEMDPELPVAHGSFIPAGAVLEDAGPTGSATHVTVVGGGEGYRASIPIDEMIGKGRLILAHDGVLRLLVPEGRTLCWNVKDVAMLRVTGGKEPDDVPANSTH